MPYRLQYPQKTEPLLPMTVAPVPSADGWLFRDPTVIRPPSRMVQGQQVLVSVVTAVLAPPVDGWQFRETYLPPAKVWPTRGELSFVSLGISSSPDGWQYVDRMPAPPPRRTSPGEAVLPLQAVSVSTPAVDGWQYRDTFIPQ